MTAALGMPVGALAQSAQRAQLGMISGETVDAGGRALASQRVELVQAGQVLQTATSGSLGEWSFTNVAPGEYVARTMVNGQVTGVRVLVTAGQAVTKALIVAPSAAAASPAFLAALGLLGGTLVAAGVAVAIAIPVAVHYANKS